MSNLGSTQGPQDLLSSPSSTFKRITLNPVQKLQLDLETDEVYQEMRMARDLASTTASGDQKQVLTAQLDKVIEKYVERKRNHAKLKSMMPNSSMGKGSA
jgi:hypothetical protein